MCAGLPIMPNPQQLITDNLNIWTAAIKKRGSQGRGSSKKIELHGIKKLRELILESAVRGLLVPQNPNDEPASVLLEKIAAEKERLIKDKKIKKQKPLPEITDEEKPFELPKGWEWQRVVDVFYPISVSKNKIKTSEILEEGEIPVVDQGQSFVAGYTNRVDLEIMLPGPVIIFGDHTSALKFVEFNFVAGADGVKILRPVGVGEEYFYLVAKTLPIENRGYGRHYSRLVDNLFPLPPEAEQPRIVAKVDELMALCDQLEQQTESSLTAHQTLIETLLNSLLDAAQAYPGHASGLSDDTDLDLKDDTTRHKNKTSNDPFQQAWQRIWEHFDVLFTTEHSIDELKQTILQLAVMGKLVPQDPNDEPASVLLEKIAVEKEQLIKDGKIKKQKPLPEISEDEKPFGLPKGWEWVRLDDVCYGITSGSTPPKSEFLESKGVPYLKVYNIKEQEIAFDYKPQYVRNEYHSTKLKRSILYPGDVVMNIVGPPLGKVAIIPADYPEWNCNQAITFFRPIIHEFNRYIYTYLKAGVFLNAIELIGTAGQDNISVTKSRSVCLPTPPLNEQPRIVAKVDELMTLCDTLKERIRESQVTQLHLADAMAEKALNE